MPSSASQAGSTRVYRNDDGSTSVRTGGTVAWRNNNPGNIKYGQNARTAGAIGQDDKGFAIFPSYEAGIQGMTNVIQNKYGNATIDAMMKSYAPAFENDTAAYAAFLNNKVGAPSNTLVRDLSPDQFNRLRSAIQAFEGWHPGAITGASQGDAPLASKPPIRYFDQTDATERLRDAATSLQPYDGPNVLSPRVAGAFSTPGSSSREDSPVSNLDQTMAAQRLLDRGAVNPSRSAPDPDARYLVRFSNSGSSSAGGSTPVLPSNASPSVAPTSFGDRFGNWPSSPNVSAPALPSQLGAQPLNPPSGSAANQARPDLTVAPPIWRFSNPSGDDKGDEENWLLRLFGSIGNR